MDDKAAPTITLAELYENQNQHIDALVIYKNLFKENPTNELKNKIEELKIKIFQNNTMEYSSIIDKIFSEEEKRNFHILPHEQFKTYIDSQVNLENEETYPEDLNATEEEVNIQSEQNTKIEEKKIGIFPEDTIETPEIDIREEPEEPAQTKETFSAPELGDINESQKTDQNEETIETLEIDDTKESEEPAQPEETIETLEIDDTKESEEPAQPEETIETLEIDDTKESKAPIQTEETSRTPELDDTKESKETILTDENPEISIDENNSMEDDLSLETNEEILLEPGTPDTLFELDTKEEETISIEDIIEKNKKLEEKKDVIKDTVDQLAENDIKIQDAVKPDTENKILKLFTKLSQIRPDIVERVLKENVGFDTPLADIKLSDLNYVVELLSVSENVEKTQ